MLHNIALYKKIKLIREVEERIRKIYPTDKIKSPVHLSIGHEAIAVGVCHALEKEDVIFGYYRSHAIYLAKGGDLNAMFAELYGKIDGCAKGWGGSMHLVDTSVGVNSTTAIVASSVPNAVGYAYANKLRGNQQVVVSFFGDGATEEGVVWESLNFAALHKLPILFVCENNELAIHTKQEQRQANPNIIDRAIATGVNAVGISGHDPNLVYFEASDKIDRCREGHGPFFLEISTSRWLEHVGPNEDWNLGYRTPDEVTPWQTADGVELAGSRLDSELKEQIDQEIAQQIEEAIEFAENSAFPEPKELTRYVFK